MIIMRTLLWGRKGIQTMDKLEKRKAVILNTLLESKDFVTSRELATLTGVSVRTVKNDISSLNQIMESRGVKINSVPNRGYFLDGNAESVFSELNLMTEDSKLKNFCRIPQDSNERIYYLIRKLLVVDYPLDMADLADEVYVSEVTILKNLQKANIILSKRNLKLSLKDKKNIILYGSELSKRLAISEFFFHNDNSVPGDKGVFGEGLNRQEADGIQALLRMVCREFKIVLSDISLSNLVIHVFIALIRYRFYNFIEVDDKLRREYQNLGEYAAARRLTEALEEAYDFTIPEDEIIYYAMHLRVKRIYDEIPLEKTQKDRMEDCISRCFAEIRREYGLDFSDNQELRHYLSQHIPLMIVRLKNHMSFRCPQIMEKTDFYLYAVRLTASAVKVIEEFYGIEVSRQEFLYLVIYFCFALGRMPEGEKIRIGLYNGGGRAETVMYFNEIRAAFGEENYETRIVDYHELFSGENQIDICVSTCSIEEPLGSEMVTIRSRSYLDEIRRAVCRFRIRDFDLDSYFSPRGIVPHLKGREPVQILKNVQEILEQSGVFSEQLETSIDWQCIEIGNGLVLANDTGHRCRKNFFFFGVLDKPVIWETEITKIVIIADTVSHLDKDFTTLLYIITIWMNSCCTADIMDKTWDYRQWMEFIRHMMEE